jgi:hypothetical protein
MTPRRRGFRYRPFVYRGEATTRQEARSDERNGATGYDQLPARDVTTDPDTVATLRRLQERAR